MKYETMTPLEQINYLQRYIILHSYIYYERNTNVVSDREYDLKAKELVRLRIRNPLAWRQSDYYKQFGDDYTGVTGFTLYYDLTPKQQKVIQGLANMILRA